MGRGKKKKGKKDAQKVLRKEGIRNAGDGDNVKDVRALEARMP